MNLLLMKYEKGKFAYFLDDLAFVLIMSHWDNTWLYPECILELENSIDADLASEKSNICIPCKLIEQAEGIFISIPKNLNHVKKCAKKPDTSAPGQKGKGSTLSPVPAS